VQPLPTEGTISALNIPHSSMLVNNAGLMRRGEILSISEQDWSDSFKLSVDSMFHLCKATVPHMRQAGGGAIVNTGSQWCLYPAPNHIAYNVTKAAVAAFTTNLARDCAPFNVRVNGVCPGEVHTSMLEAGIKKAGKTIEHLNKMVPFGRIGKPHPTQYAGCVAAKFLGQLTWFPACAHQIDHLLSKLCRVWRFGIGHLGLLL
jgi:NAD(P)-dependent dehydrogenase (short-subunit alcohol dehydrogenase family)